MKRDFMPNVQRLAATFSLALLAPPLLLADGVATQATDGLTPSVITNPGAEFQDGARPGAMIIGMDRTSKGRLWGCWTGTGDKRDGYFLLATSEDAGATWSKPRLAVGARTELAQKVSGALVGNLWTDPKGRLWLFFDQQLGDPQKRITNWFLRCDDPDAAEPAWSKPVLFAEGCTLNKPTVLKSGDWLLPVSDWHRRTARVFVSADEGASWRERGSVQFPDWEFDEHMTVELTDGRLWMLARTKGQPHESFSVDGGKTWSAPQQAATVQNVNARFFLRRLASGNILLVKNGPPTERLTKRSHLSAYLSDDEGKTWTGGLLLDERSSVSYPDGFQAPDGLIHILYDWNRHSDAEILLAKFREEDVLTGKLVSKDAKLLLLANKATGPKPEKLYNGIQLPDVWPPRFRDPSSTEPMEVPCLEKKPKVAIPIDIGRQLFVDDFLIEKTDLTRAFHQAKKYEGNPVFKPETPAELKPAAVCYLGHGGVFYDPSDKLIKMWYSAGDLDGALAFATSRDGFRWERPDLGLPAGGNHLLPRGGRTPGDHAGGDNCLWLDTLATNAAERLKFLVQRSSKDPHWLAVSADGRSWSDPVPAGRAGDYCSFFFNPFRKVWVYSIKRDGPRGRSRYYAESPEFLTAGAFNNSVYWCNADRLDEPDPEAKCPPQLYSLNAVAYESLLLGAFYIHLGPPNEVCAKGQFPKITEIKLGFSRDGFHWHRPDRRAFIPASRVEGSWDRAYVHSTAGVCLIDGDRLLFPFCAFSGIAPDGSRGVYHGASVGIAFLRRDGFASMDADEEGGSLTTRPVTFTGQHLFVNADCPQGELRVDVLDAASSRVLRPPFTADKIDSTRHRLGDVATFAGKPVRFRFHLKSGRLYAFWVSPSETGASRGYLAAGSPGSPSIVDTD